MKFAKIYPKYQVIEWSQNYVNYKALKKLVKLVAARQDLLYDRDHNSKDNHDEPPNKRRNVEKAVDNYLTDDVVNKKIESFFEFLESELSKVETFYVNMSSRYNDRLNNLIESKQYQKIFKYLKKQNGVEQISESMMPEVQKIKNRLIENLFRMQDLKSFCELNLKACQKILKKLDKQTGVDIQFSYFDEEISRNTFTKYTIVAKCIVQIESILQIITPDLINFEKDHLLRLLNQSSKWSISTNDKAFQLIEEDDNIELINYLAEKFNNFENVPIKYFTNLLHTAVFFQSFDCIDSILRVIPSLQDPDDINGRNFFHYLIIILGQNYDAISMFSQDLSVYHTASGSLSKYYSASSSISHSSEFEMGKESTSLIRQPLLQLLDNIPIKFRSLLAMKDEYHKTVLHYTAEFGFPDIIDIFVNRLQDWGLWESNRSIDNSGDWGDIDGRTPMELAIRGHHPITVITLLQFVSPVRCNNALLELVIRKNSKSLLRAFFSQKCYDINFTETQFNESALYLSTKLNLPEIVKLLLEYGADTEIKENVSSWTPLFVAAAEGYSTIVDLLLQYDAQKYVFDDSGWTPMEQAVLNGHLTIAKKLNLNDKDDIMKPVLETTETHIKDGSTNLNVDINGKMSTLDIGSAKPNNNFLLPTQSVLLIHLGSHDTRNKDPAIVVDKNLLSNDTDLNLEDGLSLHVTCADTNNSTDAARFDLPLEYNPDAIRFDITYRSDHAHVLMFDLVPQSGSQTIARGVANLNKNGRFVGQNKRSLSDTVAVPILCKTTLNVVATVTFEFLVVTPFQHPHLSATRPTTYWKSLLTTRLIGHRGLGKNFHNAKKLQLGENTLESFLAAASLGASYVEFDVQLTKDSVPVVYHDFLVAETGVDIPMHELTLEQFLDLNRAHNHVHIGRRHSIESAETETQQPSPLVDPPADRMRLTRTYKKNSFKGNTRGSSIAASFVTLQELFHKIPHDVGFNVELKYPMPDEAEEEESGHVMTELNHWLDTVLTVVYTHANGRDIIFSSFHPDVCIMLSLKQSAIPILFLTEAGATRMADARAASLQAAVRFANDWSLLGLVSAAEPILMAPRLVALIRSASLVCVTYGIQNNNPDNAAIEIAAGVHALIVDSVLAIHRNLTK